MDERRLFTMLMSREDREKLEAIGAALGVPLATAIRFCIRAEYRKALQTGGVDGETTNI